MASTSRAAGAEAVRASFRLTQKEAKGARAIIANEDAQKQKCEKAIKRLGGLLWTPSCGGNDPANMILTLYQLFHLDLRPMVQLDGEATLQSIRLKNDLYQCVINRHRS